MPFRKESGFSTILIVIIVLLGLVVTSYLVLKPVIFKSKANEANKEVSKKDNTEQQNEGTEGAKLVENPTSPTPTPIALTTPDPSVRIIKTPSPKPTIQPTSLPAPSKQPTPSPSLTPIPTSAPTQASTVSKPQLSLSPSSGTYNKNCKFSLNLDLDTANYQTDGTDISLSFDTSKFSVTSIETGTLYDNYPPVYFDNQSGRITVSAFPSPSSSYSGHGVVAKINFMVKSSASHENTQIKFDFDPNNKTKTIDSNVIKKGTTEDILDSVVDGNYTIGDNSC